MNCILFENDKIINFFSNNREKLSVECCLLQMCLELPSFIDTIEPVERYCCISLVASGAVYFEWIGYHNHSCIAAVIQKDEMTDKICWTFPTHRIMLMDNFIRNFNKVLQHNNVIFLPDYQFKNWTKLTINLTQILVCHTPTWSRFRGQS